MDRNTQLAWFADASNPLPFDKGFNPFGEEKVSHCLFGRNFIPLRRERNTLSIRLWNIDPQTWNVFMFPYDQSKKKIDIHHIDILSEPDGAQRVVQELGLSTQTSVDGLPFQLEMKRSKSTDLLTLYIFAYELVNFDRSFGDGESCSVTIPLDARPLDFVLPQHVATNVQPVLNRLAASFVPQEASLADL